MASGQGLPAKKRKTDNDGLSGSTESPDPTTEMRLTTDNVFRVLNRVAKGWRWVAEEILLISSSKCDEFEKAFVSQERCLKEAIIFWMKRCVFASWRYLIFRFNDANEEAVAHGMFHLAEPITDPTMTVANITSALETVSNEDLEIAIDMSAGQLEHLKGNGEEFKKALIEIGLSVHPTPTWEFLSGRLYMHEHKEAVEAVKKYIKRDLDPSLTVENLMEALKDVKNWSIDTNGFPWCIDIPASKREEMENKYPDLFQRQSAYIKYWLDTFPYPCWERICYALYWQKEYDVLERIQNKYFIGSYETRRHFQIAMEKGKTTTCVAKVVLFGAAGSGKTCTKDVILKQKPPESYTSTPLMLRPVKVYCVDMIGSPWVLLESLERDHLIARACYAFDIEQLRQLPHVSPVFIQGLTSLIRSKPRGGKIPTMQPLDSTDDIKAADNGVSNISQDKASSSFQLPLNTNQYLLRCMADISPDDLIGKIKRVQISDCGGQPQFHEILPIFVRGPTLYLFVFKLNESLSTCPQVSYYVDGKAVGASYSSTESVEQLLENCLRVVRSQKAVAKEEATIVQTATNYSQIAIDKDQKFPQIMIIGTHKDKEYECETENREAKNKKLVQLLLPEFKKEIHYYRQKPKEVVYPINARFPGKHEENIADIIQYVISSRCSKEFEIPLQWHALEVLLEKLTNTLNRQVLTKEECFAAAKTIHFDSEAALDAALDYLGHLNLVFYYPDILPNVVFVSSQILLDKVTELVKAVYHMNKGATAASTSTVQGELWQKFCDYARVSAEFLKQECFQEHYHANFFTHDHLIVLFRKLLIFADFSNTEYFVPALLKKLKREELDRYRAKPTTPITSLILMFVKHGGPLLGVFCATVVALLSEDNVYPCPWELNMDPDDEVTPTCLYRNCVQFMIPKHSGVITLIESFEHIEVHTTGIAGKYCQVIKQGISKALRKATIALHYEFSEPEVGFSCPCGKSTFHLAKVCADRESWICSKDVCKSGALTSNQKIWFAPKDPEKAVLLKNSIPRLHQLQLIKENEKEIRVIKRIASRWSNVALGLRFDHCTIDMITKDSHHQSEPACHSMFNRWLNGEGRMPTTWQTLIEALHEADFHTIAQDIQEIVN